MEKMIVRFLLASVLILGLLSTGAVADVIDDWSVGGNWGYHVIQGAEFMWGDAPNPWHYTSGPGSQRIWFKTTGGDSQQSQLFLQRNNKVWDFSNLSSFSWNVRAENTQNPSVGVDLQMRLMLYDETYNAWVMTPTVDVTYGWSTYSFSKNGTPATGATGEFYDAWNAGQFHWDNIELLRFVFMEPSGEYAANQDIHVFLDDFTAAPVPEPSSMAALGMGAFGLVGFAIRRRK